MKKIGARFCLLALFVASVFFLAAPSVAQEPELEPIVGQWTLEGIGKVRVSAAGGPAYTGTVLERISDSTCWAVGQDIWHISGGTEGSYSGSVAWFDDDCAGLGDAPATWTMSEDAQSVTVCSNSPKDGHEECVTLTRAGCPGTEFSKLPQIIGTSGNDRKLTGTSASEIICGLGGDDRIEGGGGNDILLGNGGIDTIIGSNDAEESDGGKGNDTIVAHGNPAERVPKNSLAGVDLLIGGPGEDVLNGKDGGDRIEGGGDHDEIYGAEGFDSVSGGGVADDISGGDHADSLFGDGGGDRIRGGGGIDTIRGYVDDDKIWGEDGGDRDDREYLEGGAGEDRIWGGDGFERIVGGIDPDHLWGEGDADIVVGDSGRDHLYGGPGSDELLGGPDFDVCFVTGSDVPARECEEYRRDS